MRSGESCPCYCLDTFPISHSFFCESPSLGVHVQANKEPEKQVGTTNKSSLLVCKDSTVVTLPWL